MAELNTNSEKIKSMFKQRRENIDLMEKEAKEILSRNPLKSFKR